MREIGKRGKDGRNNSSQKLGEPLTDVVMATDAGYNVADEAIIYVMTINVCFLLSRDTL